MTITEWKSIFEALDQAGFPEDFPNRDLRLPQDRGDILNFADGTKEPS